MVQNWKNLKIDVRSVTHTHTHTHTHTQIAIGSLKWHKECNYMTSKLNKNTTQKVERTAKFTHFITSLSYVMKLHMYIQYISWMCWPTKCSTSNISITLYNYASVGRARRHAIVVVVVVVVVVGMCVCVCMCVCITLFCWYLDEH